MPHTLPNPVTAPEAIHLLPVDMYCTLIATLNVFD